MISAPAEQATNLKIPFAENNLRERTTTFDRSFFMSRPASSRRGVEQILATADNTMLVIKATKDGKLDVTSNSLVKRRTPRGAKFWRASASAGQDDGPEAAAGSSPISF
jgi:hypothetical protein